MKNNKKTTFLGIFLAFFGFYPILGMSRIVPSISDEPIRCASPDETYYKKPGKTSSSSSALSLLEEASKLDVRTVITGEIPPRCTAPALEERPEKCASPEIIQNKKPHHRTAQQIAVCLFQSDAQKKFLAKPNKEKTSCNKQSTAEHNPLILPDNNDGDIDESGTESCATPYNYRPSQLPKNNELYLENTGTTVLVSPRSSRNTHFLSQLSQHNSDDDRKTDEVNYAATHFRTITPSKQEQSAGEEITPISRFTSQAQSGSSSTHSIEKKSALKQSPAATPRARNKRTVSYSDNLSILSENNEIFIERISQTAPVSQRSTPLSVGIPGQVDYGWDYQEIHKTSQAPLDTFFEEEEEKQNDQYTFDKPMSTQKEGPFGGFFDPKSQKKQTNPLEDFFAPKPCAHKHDVINEFFGIDEERPNQFQSAPVSPHASHNHSILEDIKEESPVATNITKRHSQSAPVSRPGSAHKISRVKRMVNCLLLPFTKHKNHSK